MSLKARLNDSNKNLVMMTLATLGSIATAMGSVVEKHSKVSTGYYEFIVSPASWLVIFYVIDTSDLIVVIL